MVDREAELYTEPYNFAEPEPHFQVNQVLNCELEPIIS
jgi:hypothetical protein